MNKLTFLILLTIPFGLKAQETGSITDGRDSEYYQTVKIGDYWWMADNLRYGTRINGSQNQTDNSITEKYCYGDSESNCDSYGGLYQWNELMNYSTVEMTQGVCPDGWHVPSEDEWQELEIYLGMDPSDAASVGLRGTDQGTQLKAGGSSGFEALMAGKRNTSAVFENLGTYTTFWTSSGTNRTLSSSWAQIYNGGTYDDENNGFSLRCVREDDVIEEDIIFIADHQYTNMHLPFEPSYSYSYTQSIIPKSKINRTGSIIKIYFNFNLNQLITAENLDIYLGTTNKTGFSNNNDWIPINELEKVDRYYTDFHSLWTEIEVNDIYFDNTKNLVIAIHDRDYSSYSSNTDFYCTSIPESNASIFYYSNSSISVTSPPTALGRYSFIPNIGLNFAKFDVIPFNISDVTDHCIGDINSDGFMDGIVLSDDTIVFLINNGSNNFTQLKTNLQSNDLSEVFDVDNDNDVDISSLINGRPSVYINDNGSFSPVVLDYALNLSSCNISSNDYDNDGDQDIFLTAWTNNSPLLQVYKNNGDYSFSKTDLNFNQLSGSIIFEDFDMNGWTDILLTGRDVNSNYLGVFYMKDENEFSQQHIQNEAIGGISTDFDFDGDFDVLNPNRYWENNINEFISLQLTSIGIYYGTDWADIDSDGDLDFLYGNSSRNQSFASNNGSLNFTNGYVETPIDEGYFSWYDFDNDRDIDNLCLSWAYDPRIIYHTINRINNENYPPTVPTGLNSTVSFKSVLLECSPSIDPEKNSSNGIKYNFYVKSATDDNFILSPMARLQDGKPLTINFANSSGNNSINLQNLPPDEYYWGVQAIDNSNFCSGFSVQNSFTIEPQFIEAVYLPGSFTWGDTDNDGDMDFFTGSQLYINQGNNTFTTTEIFNYSWTEHNADFGDFDNDGDLDLLFTSYELMEISIFNDITCVYENHGNNNFDINNPIYLSASQPINKVEWGDLDNDGDLDIICLSDHHFMNENAILELYENKSGGVFEKHILDTRGVSRSYSFSLHDIDMDYDLDIITSGDTLGATTDPIVLMYENNGNLNFTERVINIEGKSNGYIFSFDFNNDYLPDILSTGKNKYYKYFNSIYSGDGNLNFEFENNEFKGKKISQNSFGDINNDGFLDFALYNSTSIIYENDHNFIFDIFNQDNEDINGKTVRFCDFNDDYYMDIVGSGRLYENSYTYGYLIPGPPVNISHILDTNYVTLSWEKTVDQINNSHTFNVRVGTSPNGIEIVSPGSDITTGYRKIQKLGNAQYKTSFRLNDLPKGKYYWSVQSINANFKGSAWSGIDSFLISDLIPKFYFDTVCAGSYTHFVDSSISTVGNIIAWHWDFGDGESLTIPSPSHIYEKGGTYKVTLTIQNSDEENSLSRNVIVKYNAKADFTTDIVCEGEGTKTTFTDNSNIDSLSGTDWLWSFGDGDFSSDSGDIQHPYLLPDTYHASLKIIASNGCSDSITKEVIVAEKPNNAIGLDYGNRIFCEGDSSQISVEHDDNYIYQWKLNDFNITGATTNQLKIKNSGDYAVVITNPVGDCTVESETETIIVVPTLDPPAISSSIVPAIICSGDSVRLSSTYNADYHYQWRLNEGTIGSDTSIFYAKTEGYYTLEISMGDGCTSSPSTPVFLDILDPLDKPAIEVSGPTGICTGDSVILSIPQNNIYTYKWKKEGLDILNANNNSYLVKTEGTYSIKISNDEGCSNESNSVQITVSDAPAIKNISALTDTIICEGQTVELNVPYNPDYLYQWKLNGIDIFQATGNTFFALEEGQYSIDIEIANCMITTATKEIRFKPGSPKPNIVYEGIVHLFLGCDVTDAADYRWYYNGNLIPGAKSNLYFAGTNYGEYYVEVNDGGECYVPSDKITISAMISSSQNSSNDYIAVTPNPNNGEFYLNFMNENSGDFLIKITDLNGSVIYKTKITKDLDVYSKKLRLDNPDKGFYLLKILHEKQIMTLKFLVF